MHLIRLTLILIAASVLFASQSSAELLPHKATYTIALTKAAPASGLVSIDGDLDYQLEHSCEGWITNYAMDLNYHFSNAPSVRIQNTLSTFESIPQKSYSFSLKHSAGGNILTRDEGKASQDSGVTYINMLQNGEELKAEHNKDIYFPIHHTEEIIKRAANGDRFFSVDLFDGTEGDAVTKVSAVIGKSQKTPKNNEHSIPSTTHWPSNFAYFRDNASEVPELEMKAILHDNGVIEDVLITYPDFTLSQQLEEIEPLQKYTCKSKKIK